MRRRSRTCGLNLRTRLIHQWRMLNTATTGRVNLPLIHMITATVMAKKKAVVALGLLRVKQLRLKTMTIRMITHMGTRTVLSTSTIIKSE